MKFPYSILTTLCTSFLIAIQSSCAQPVSTPEAKISVDISAYKWLMPQYNMIQFYSRSAFDKFHNHWKNASTKRVNILMLGDSHLQGDVYPGQLRKRIHKTLGDAGRGLMFAFSTAKTYSSIEYKTEHLGNWTPQRSIGIAPKLPMGVRGMTCRTEEDGSMLSFNFNEDVPTHYNKLKIFCKRSKSSFDLFVEAGGKTKAVEIDESNDGLSYVEVELSPIRDKNIKLHVVKKNNYETEFEFYGMSLESNRTHGAIIHNAGVGAARYNSILYQSLFEQQLPDFDASLVIIDFGTNDYIATDEITPDIEKDVRKVIDVVKKGAPNASILLTTTQDLFWKGRNCQAGETFSDFIHKVAAEKDCAVFDWYWISGAQGTMKTWQQYKLAQGDLIHLTQSGYELKGNLLFDAIVSTIGFMDKNPQATSLVLSTDELRADQMAIRNRTKNTKVVPVSNNSTAANTRSVANTNAKTQNGKKQITHTVATGETLGVIARKHKVSTSEIAKWNNLANPNKLKQGQKLIIYK